MTSFASTFNETETETDSRSSAITHTPTETETETDTRLNATTHTPTETETETDTRLSAITHGLTETETESDTYLKAVTHTLTETETETDTMTIDSSWVVKYLRTDPVNAKTDIQNYLNGAVDVGNLKYIVTVPVSADNFGVILVSE